MRLSRPMKRKTSKQSEHDAVIKVAAGIYNDENMWVRTNPGSEQNYAWSGLYIDVIAKEDSDDDGAYVTEIETAESVSENEARDQWKSYDEAYDPWYLAVPSGTKSDAQALLDKFNLSNCARVYTWWYTDNGKIAFSNLPGLS